MKKLQKSSLKISSLRGLAAAAVIAGAGLWALPGMARTFVHPGLSYTDADFTRMRAMIASGKQPYVKTFEALKASGYSNPAQGVPERGSQIKEGAFNNMVGIDGRKAHDLALLWKLTDDTRYADKAVEFLNANSYYTNTSARGTGPLDNGKVYLLIEAAEMLRDYAGWKAEDQQRFKDMLVYPGYSSTENQYDLHANSDDAQNGITFYWNIFNFDASRFGNQGLFAARAMMAMGVYLDNDKIYDRALRYLRGLPHREDDLPYVAGPPRTSENPYALDETAPEAGDKTTTFMLGYSLQGRDNSIEDYGYDEQLRYYIYKNGQSQEACRDQDHAMVGVGLLADVAEIAWNQGDDFYGDLDNRILKGMEWSFRYNLSFIETPGSAWEPSQFTTDEDEASFENGAFLRVRSRSGRWESKLPSTKGRGDSFGAGGNREQALAHYMIRVGEKTRASENAESYRWLKAYRDYMMDNFGYESYGKDTGHAYEWKGWGSLTKRLDPIEDSVETGVEEATVIESVAEADEYISLQGIRIKEPTAPGIYLRKKNGKMEKVAF